jgi:hypothetical protein
MVSCVAIAAASIQAQAASLASSSRATPDFQSWDEVDISARLRADIDVTWVSLTRFSAQLPNPAVYASGVDVNVGVGTHLVITPSYYYIAFRTVSSPWAHTDTPILAATVLESWNAWTLSDRGRVAGILDDGKGYWIYLNRPRVDYAMHWGRWDGSLFAWDEVSYYSIFSKWSRNRAAAGARLACGSRWAVDLYGLHQNDSEPRPHQINGVGVTLELRIR